VRGQGPFEVITERPSPSGQKHRAENETKYMSKHTGSREGRSVENTGG